MSLEQNENFFCPYCGESNSLNVDVTGGSVQEFIIDCEVCCAPIMVRLKITGGDVIAVEIKKENE